MFTYYYFIGLPLRYAFNTLITFLGGPSPLFTFVPKRYKTLLWKCYSLRMIILVRMVSMEWWVNGMIG